jgi:hypothetical protein
MALPPPDAPRDPPRIARPIAFAATLGGGVCLLAVIIGLTVLGGRENSDVQISATGLATIGATLAGAFAAWMGGGGMPRRGGSQDEHEDEHR